MSFKSLGDFKRVFIVHFFSTVVSLRKAYALAVYDVYGGDDSHNSKKFWSN